jgi:hypothetical protein
MTIPTTAIGPACVVFSRWLRQRPREPDPIEGFGGGWM